MNHLALPKFVHRMLWNITQVWVNTYYILKKWLPEDQTYILVSREEVEITQAKAGRKKKERKNFQAQRLASIKVLRLGGGGGGKAEVQKSLRTVAYNE